VSTWKGISKKKRMDTEYVKERAIAHPQPPHTNNPPKKKNNNEKRILMERSREHRCIVWIGGGGMMQKSGMGFFWGRP